MAGARLRAVIAPVLFLLAFMSLWQGHVINDVFGLEEFAVPLPDQIVQAASDNRDALAGGFGETFQAVALGWLIGNALGFALALVVLWLPPVIAPRISSAMAAVQALPIIALAPLVALWIDSSVWFKTVTVTIMVFPSMAVYAHRGMTAVDTAALELAHSYDASGWQVLRMIRLPTAVPQVFTALRYTVILALIGVVVCEILKSADGLGYEIHDALQRFETPHAWAAVGILALAGIVSYSLLLLVERVLAPWALRRG